MAPEQAAGSKLDHRVDQFSTGIILWEMLTGQKLFAGEGQAQTLMAVLEANIPIPSHLRPEIPKELDEIVLKALSKDPENRFSNMRTFQQSLGRFIHSLPPEINDDDVVSWVEAVFEGEKSFDRQTQIRNSDKTPNTKTADLVFEDTNQVSPHAPTAVKQSVISSAEASSVTLQGAPMVVTENDDTPPTSSRKIGRAAFMGIVGISMVGLVMQQLGPFEREQHSGESRTADSRETHPKPIIKKAATKQNVVPKIPVAADEKKITIPTVKKRASLKRKKMIKGTVLVDVLNSWAEVWLGTKKLGETPLKVSLPVGRYELILKNPETKKQKVIETTLKAEGNKALRIQF